MSKEALLELKIEQLRAALDASRASWRGLDQQFARLAKSFTLTQGVIDAARALIYGNQGGWRKPEDFDALEEALQKYDREHSLTVPTKADDCKLVIPGTFIACGEAGNYCSDECLRKSNTNHLRTE